MSSNIYFGAEESWQQRRGVRLSVTSYEREAAIPKHEHANAYLCISTAGGFVERSGRSEREVRVHDLVYHPPGHPHSDRFSESGGRCLNLEMDPAWLAGLPRAASATTPIYISDPDMRRIGRALIRESLQAEGTTSLAVDSLLLELFSRFRGPSRRRNGRPPPWLLAVRDRLRSNYAERHTLTALADTAGVHPVHLAREFRRQFGCPVHVYVRRCRIEAAANLLADSDRPLAEIAFDLGFCGQSHFSRAFGVLKGVAPGMYRRRARDRKR